MKRVVATVALGSALVLAGLGCGGSISAAAHRSASAPGHGILLVGHEYEKSRIFFWRPGSPVEPLTAADYGISGSDWATYGLSDGFWSPDGRSIAYEEDSPEGLAPPEGAVYVMRSDGTHAKVVSDITFSPGDGLMSLGDGPPSWSPDGRQIVYEQFITGPDPNRFVIVDVRSGHERTLPFSGGYPVWGKAGIAYTTVSGIMLLNPATGRSRLVTSGFNGLLALSPGGVLAAVERTQIVLLTASGRVLDKLPAPPATRRVCAIAWSPDGKQILAASDANGNLGLWVGTVSTKHWQRLPRVPAWKNEGNYECAVSWR